MTGKSIWTTISTIFAIVIYGFLILILKKDINRGIVLGTLFIFYLVGFSEELLYRGYLQPEAIKALGKYKGLLFTSIYFGLIHLPNDIFVQQTGGIKLFLQPLSQTIGGILLGLVYIKSENIWAPSAMHALMNSLVLLSQ